jgi:two-component system NtrC family response regulator
MYKLIVVEDEPDLLDIISRILVDDGHLVRCAINARQALELLKIEEADLIISDISTPGFGLDYLLQGLRTFPKQPCILIFSGADEEELRKYREFPIVRKPTGFDQIRQRVFELLK